MKTAHYNFAYMKAQIVGVLACAAAMTLAPLQADASRTDDEYGAGELSAVDKTGKPLGALPLKHTKVDVEISGFVSRVTVRQQFHNPYDDKIEAVYTFPLHQDSAVDEMTMTIGDRTVRGEIKERNEAIRIYEEAKHNGRVASLLEQERPNIFTQSVANIEPGKEIFITIKYVQTLVYEDGRYEYSFPMVVGPRYIPGEKLAGLPSGTGWAMDTDVVTDASRITPPVLKPGERSGHDIELSVTVDAGIEIEKLMSPSHDIRVNADYDDGEATVTLAPHDTIPNKDFILRYNVAGEKPKYGILTHADERGGFFTVMLQPQERARESEITPRELIFVVDNSGSMSGAPMNKAKEAMRRVLKNMHPEDTFQVLRFSEKASGMSPRPIPNNPANLQKGINYVNAMRGMGGTAMIEGIKAALDSPRDPERLRIVLFMTDGYIGNEAQILAAVGDKLGNARLFSFGVGSSVNRYLLDEMALAGRGAVQYVRPDEDTESVVSQFYERIAQPYLTDIELEFDGVKVSDVFPKLIPDLFVGQPVEVAGKYKGGGNVTVTLKGKVAGKKVEQEFELEFPENQAENESLASVWARRKLADLHRAGYHGPTPELVKQMTDTAIEYHLMSEYTAFVAVDEFYVTEGGVPRKVVQPVELPEFVSYEGVFGDGSSSEARKVKASRGYGGGSMNMLGGMASYGSGSSGALGVRRAPEASPAPGYPHANQQTITRSYPITSSADKREDADEAAEVAGEKDVTALVTLGSIDGPASADREIIARTLHSRIKRIEFLFKRELQLNPNLRGEVVLKLHLTARGLVSKVEIKSSTVNNKRLEQALILELGRLRFDGISGGETVVEYPLKFRVR